MVTRLALADLWADRVLGLCTVLALAAVLAPLVVLAGLRAGVVEGLRQTLLQDPHAREVMSASNRTFPTELLQGLEKRPDVDFLVPRTRTITASILMRKKNEFGGTQIEIIPSKPGDPLIPHAPAKSDEIVLSAAAAAKLRVKSGDVVIGNLTRQIDGQRQAVVLSMKVADVAPAASFVRPGAFVTLPLALLIEDYQDGVVNGPIALSDLSESQRTSFAGFRLYAKHLEDVPALDSAIRAMDIDINSKAGDVATLLAIDRNLGILFELVAGLGGAGFLISLGAGLWANVERKRVPLALLRFLGLRRMNLSIFPVVQATALVLFGAIWGISAAYGAQILVNQALAGTLAIDRPLCAISSAMALMTVVVTLTGAVMVASIASLRAAGIEPWEGVSAP